MGGFSKSEWLEWAGALMEWVDLVYENGWGCIEWLGGLVVCMWVGFVVGTGGCVGVARRVGYAVGYELTGRSHHQWKKWK